MNRTWQQPRLYSDINQSIVRSCWILVAGLLMTAATMAQGTQVWAGSWAAAPFAQTGGQQMPDFTGVTLRQIVHTSLAGTSLCIRFTNEFGQEPLEIDAAQVAISAGHSSIQPQTDHKITFNGKSRITIPAGSMVMSDTVPLAVPTSADLAISIYLPGQQISTATFHAQADQTAYLQKGNLVSSATLDASAEIGSWYFLKGVDVTPQTQNAQVIVTLGDSITDGVGSSPNANRRWPDVLADRLHSNAATSHFGVLNEGIGANRLLREGTGPSALARFDRDVLAQSGVKYVIVLEGINDIGRLARKNDPQDAVSAEDIEFALQQLAMRAHDRNIKLIAATLTPYKGAGYYTEKGEEVRQSVNQWIRTNNILDGVIDFDKVVQDPANPGAFLPLYDSHDHLHPNDAGYRAMGNAIDLSLFR